MTIIVADLGSLRAFRVVPNENSVEPSGSILKEIDVALVPEPPQRISDAVSDQAGRFRSDGTPGMARGEAHGLEQEQERRSLAELAAGIDQVLAAEGHGKWALAAPKTFNARLVTLLSPGARERLGQNLLTDLCKQPILEIQKRFQLPMVSQ